MIFIDHVPGNPLYYFTFRGFALADAAEIFVLVSGYTAGLVYGRVLDRDGLGKATSRIWQRALRIYSTHLLLFLVFAITTVGLARYVGSPAYASWQGFSVGRGWGDLLCRGDHTISSIFVLKCQPDLLAVLPAYTVFMLFLPAILVAVRVQPLLTVAVSALLWVVVQVTGVNLPSSTLESGWLFNPLAWQFLFVIGVWLGSTRHGTVNRFNGHAILSNQEWRPAIVRAAVAIALLCAAIQIFWSLGGSAAWADGLLPEAITWRLAHKGQLGPARLVSILALLVLTPLVLRRDARFLHGRLARPIITCGQHSLAVFSLGILLAQWSEMVVTFVSGRIPVIAALNVAGIALQIGFAAMLAQSKSRHRATAKAVSSVGMIERGS